MLQQYFLLLRQVIWLDWCYGHANRCCGVLDERLFVPILFHLQAGGQDEVRIQMLSSMAAVAAACARLHLRAAILPVPDVALAIKISNESLTTKVELTLPDIILSSRYAPSVYGMDCVKPWYIRRV